MSNKYLIVIVEDEYNISSFVSAVLQANGFDTMVARNGAEAIILITSHCPDLVLLDLGLPDMDGQGIIENVRGWSNVPIIVVSARTRERDKVMALESGADDYITKPFNPLEVVARVKTQLRRYVRYNQPINKQALENIEYDIRGLSINKNNHKCSLFGKELQLTPIEFSILWYLCDHQGKVVSSEELFEAVWKEKYLDNNNTVMAHIGRLREKMKEPAKKPKFIKTVWGVGYTIE